MDNKTYLCRDCGNAGDPYIGTAYELRDSMHDRAPVRAPVDAPCCSDCGSEDLEPCELCVECQVRPATVEGTDYCIACNEASLAEERAAIALRAAGAEPDSILGLWASLGRQVDELKQELT